jgi:hypothetical protein
MSLTVDNLDQAILLLKNVVKYSAIDGQKHLDFSICIAEERASYQKALMLAQTEVEKGTLSSDELKKRLGLI